MKVLIIGNGGREHALAWQAAKSGPVSAVYVAPGNAGTALENKVHNIDIKANQTELLIEFAKKNHIDITIIGPEAPLASGIVDAFVAQNLACFGPTKAAAQLESSKAFTKDFCQRFAIPSANYAVFSDTKSACEYIQQQGAPIVVKADGLAAGKGVIVAQSVEQAQTAAKEMLEQNRFGDAGARVVVEQFLTGEEASFICMVDGNTIVPLATSQDHKARDNQDKGPNTGGMGAYSPAPAVNPTMHQRIIKNIIEPTVKGMQQLGHRYTGFLYAGIMINSDGEPSLLEFNCRFGDPETQPIMMRLQSNIAQLCLLATQSKLQNTQVQWDKRAALGVVLAAKGYPDNYPTGQVISGLNQDFDKDCKVFHAGSAQKNTDIVTAGGRVLCVTALGDTVTQAQQKAYKAAQNITWQDQYYRTDIGYRAIDRES